MFPSDLEVGTFRLSNGEYGWTREQIPRVIGVLVENNLGILGGELWWVPLGAETFHLEHFLFKSLHSLAYLP